MRNRSHSLEAVAVGIARFLDDMRTTQGLDAEPELRESAWCRHQCGRPAAIHGECFSCAARRLPC